MCDPSLPLPLPLSLLPLSLLPLPLPPPPPLRRQDPNLWVQALSYFSSRKECKGHIGEVLQHIDEEQLMPPLMVIQALAESQFATLSDIKVSFVPSPGLVLLWCVTMVWLPWCVTMVCYHGVLPWCVAMVCCCGLSYSHIL